MEEEKELTQKYYPVNRPMRIAGIGFVGIFLLFLLAKAIFPQKDSAWSDPPIIDFLLISGFSTAIFIISTTHAYYSWTLNKKEYTSWYLQQMELPPRTTWSKSYQKWLFGKSTEGYRLWATRLIAPIGSLFGIAIFAESLYAIFNLIF